MIDDVFQEKDLTERKYYLKCKARIHRLVVNDANRSYESRILILVPEINDQCVQFFQAWLPDTSEQFFEVGAFINAPIASPARLSIHRRNDRCDQHHMTVMSKGVAEEIEKFAMSQTIFVDILPGSDELLSLESKESDGDYTKLDI